MSCARSLALSGPQSSRRRHEASPPDQPRADAEATRSRPCRRQRSSTARGGRYRRRRGSCVGRTARPRSPWVLLRVVWSRHETNGLAQARPVEERSALRPRRLGTRPICPQQQSIPPPIEVAGRCGGHPTKRAPSFALGRSSRFGRTGGPELRTSGQFPCPRRANAIEARCRIARWHLA